jgi:hypothetical protein
MHQGRGHLQGRGRFLSLLLPLLFQVQSWPHPQLQAHQHLLHLWRHLCLEVQGWSWEPRLQHPSLQLFAGHHHQQLLWFLEQGCLVPLLPQRHWWAHQSLELGSHWKLREQLKVWGEQGAQE